MWSYTFTNSVVPNHCHSPGDPSLLGTCRPAAGIVRTCFSKWLTRWAWRYMCLHHCFTAAVKLMVPPWKCNNKPPSCKTVDCWCCNVDVVFSLPPLPPLRSFCLLLCLQGSFLNSLRPRESLCLPTLVYTCTNMGRFYPSSKQLVTVKLIHMGSIAVTVNHSMVVLGNIIMHHSSVEWHHCN